MLKSTTNPLQNLFRIGQRRKPTLKPTSVTTVTSTTARTTTKTTRRLFPILPTKQIENQEVASPRSTESRFKFPSRPTIVRTSPKRKSVSISQLLDQHLESSNQQSLEEDFATGKDTTELTDIALALQDIQHAPLPKSKTSRTASLFPSSTPKVTLSTRTPTRHRFRYTTTSPPVLYTTKKFAIRKTRPQAFEKITPTSANTFRPLTEYDYYEDGESIIGTIPEHSKVLLHSNGVIECLDQGNFPHPVSCKKFIYCAKMDSTRVLGWEYTCPKNLSFDPIGGICNWSAGLGCNER